MNDIKYYRLNITSKGITKLSVDVVKITGKNLVIKRESYSNRHVPIENLNKVIDANRFIDFTPDLICWCDETHVDECIKMLQDALSTWINKSLTKIDDIRSKVKSYTDIAVGIPLITEKHYNDF